MSAPIKLKTPGLKIHNKYTLQLFDTEGHLIQEAFAYNQASARRYAMVCLTGKFPGKTDDDYYRSGINSVHLGTGTGTIDVESREFLFARAFSAKISWTRTSDFTFNNMHFSASATFPPTTSYVGDLTEIGLGTDYYNRIFSHALLVDAEDNPIVVQKTSTNILVVTVDVFFTAILPTQPFNFLYDPPEASSMAGAYFKRIGSIPYTPSILPIVGGRTFYFSPAYMPDKATDKIAKNCTAGLLSTTGWDASGTGSTFPYQLTALNKRSDATDNNFGFAHSIVFPGFGTIPLPNESIIPAYNYNGINIGTGDGTTTHWLPAVNEVVSAKVYVDGELTDASFQNFDPRKSPLWNKCIKVEYLNKNGVFATRDIPSTSIYTSGDTINQVACIAIPMSNMVAAQYINGTPTLQGFAPSIYTSRSDSSSTSWGTNVIYYDAAGITLDHFRVGKQCEHSYSTPSYEYSQPNDRYPYYLEYSDDGSTWTTAATATASYITYYFEAITAKYWRLRGGALAGHVNDSAEGFAITPSEEAYRRVGYDQKAIVAGNSAEFDFGKCGINFTTAPAAGTTITMDAVLNLPYKDNNIVFICSYEAEVPDPGEAT